MSQLRKRCEEAALELIAWATADSRSLTDQRARIADAIEAEAKRFAEAALDHAIRNSFHVQVGDSVSGHIAEAIKAAEGVE